MKNVTINGKKSIKVKDVSKNRIRELKKKIEYNELKIDSLWEENGKIWEEILKIEISPFKIGDYAMAEVNAGRTKKMQKCLLENARGILYLRPVKENGELSGRNFKLIPVGKKTYKDYLKPVEE